MTRGPGLLPLASGRRAAYNSARDMLWLGAFGLLVVLLILWAAVIAPRMGKKVFAGLEAKGWHTVAPEDETLRSALDALRPLNLGHSLPDDGRLPELTVLSALARSGPDGTRYLVQVRSCGPDASVRANVVSTNTLVLEPRRLGFSPGSVYVLARDRETRARRTVEILGLQSLETGLDPGFRGQFMVLQEAGAAPRLPSPLQQALLASADLFIHGAGASGRHLPNVCVRLTPSGWAALVPEPIVTETQMQAFTDTAERLSQGLSAA